MKRDTSLRITKYKELLPKAKEKVFISAILLLIATVVASSVTLAWITLSRAPVIMGMETVLISNGSLEIGLSKPNGGAPDEFDVDEFVGVSTDVMQTNLQWGNIINLADSRYGIESIALRPAELSSTTLNSRPLKAADYGFDGRITGQGDTYTYFKYDVNENMLMTSTERGVRAIAHYTTKQTELSSTAIEYAGVRDIVSAAHQAVNNQYKNNVISNSNIQGLQGLMSAYMQSEINKRGYGPSSDTNVDITGYLGQLHSLYDNFYKSMEMERDALVELANAQQYAYAKQHSDENTTVSYTSLDWDAIVSNQNKFDPTGAQHKATPSSPEEAVTLTGLKQFIADMATAKKDNDLLTSYYDNNRANGTKYTWNDIEGGGEKNIVTRLCSPGTVTINGKTISQYGTKDLLGMLNGTYPVKIMSGLIARFEQLAVDSSYRVSAKITLSGKAKMIITVNVNITGNPVTTGASGASNFAADFASMPLELETTLKVADDTFGVAIDFWVRTNADAGFLTLEGETKGRSQAVRMTGFDDSGNVVELYTITDKSGALDESGQALTWDVYKKDNAYYYNNSNTAVDSAVLGSQTPIEKYDNDVTVIGYEGSNRVWEENPLLTADSTTQGSGSCYVYYADTPEDMARSLDLLQSMRVAFFEEGANRLLAIGSMDTDHAYALNGRVTVPLFIDGTMPQNSENQYTVESADGSETTGYYIAPLYQDIPQQITALIYLDGVSLTNDDVLATEEIQGQLNIQFGSSKPLDTMGDDRLQSAERHVSATVSKTELNYDTAETAEDLTTTVTVTVDGEDPNTVTAFFVRAINAQQGKRQKEMTFRKTGNGTFTADYTFAGPGTYYLRYVRLNGIDYALSEPCMVEVTGFEVETLTWGVAGSHNTVYTAEGSYDVPVAVTFQSQNTNKQPNTVEARFIRTDGNTVSVTMTRQGTQWKGTGHFTASGDYSLDYLVVNGDYYALKKVSEDGFTFTDFTKSLSLHLGMSTEVFNDGAGTNEEFDPDAFSSNDKMYNKPVYAKIYDNAGNELKGLLDGKLKYSKNRSTSGTIDTDLTWDADRQVYTGTLPIASVGRYAFLSLQIGNNTITGSKGAPTYVITPPNPPRYSTSSQSAYNTSRQFVLPDQLNAIIGPFTITDAEAGGISAVVHNSITGEDYEITQSQDSNPKPGEMWYSNVTKTWTINLPVYTTTENDTQVQHQAGTWTVEKFRIWDVYDADMVLHEESDPLVWNAESGYNFSRLSTTVSDTIKVTMVPGATAVGSASVPFFTDQNMIDSGAYVTVTDKDGNPIVGIDGNNDSMKVTEIKYTLGYTGNNDLAYGYKVDSNAQPSSYAFFGSYADGRWTLTTNPTTPYVGVFTVNGLDVTVKKGTSVITISSTANSGMFEGIPESYTVTAAAPTAKDNLIVGELSAYVTEYGKDANGAVTGEFLHSYNIKPKLTVDVVADKTSRTKAEHVSVEGLTVQMQLNHVAGTESEYGHYTYSGGNPAAMETITFNMTQQSGTNKFSDTKQLKLAGEYTAALTIGIGNDKTTYRSTDAAATLSAAGMSNLKGVEVWSVSPTITITGVSPTSAVVVNPAAGIQSTTNNLFSAANNYGSDFAVVYMEYNVSSKQGTYNGSETTTDDSAAFADYSAPSVSFAFSNGGTRDAQLTINGDNGVTHSHTFTASGSTWTTEIGTITAGTDNSKVKTVTTINGKTGETSTVDYNVSYPTELPKVIGSQKIETVSSVVDGVTFTRMLTNPIFLVEENTKVDGYAVSWNTPAGATWSVKKGSVGISRAEEIAPNTAMTVILTAQEGYYNPRVSQPNGVANWTVVSEGESEATYTFTSRFEAVSLQASIQKYPTVSLTNGSNTTLAMQIGGVNKPSGIGVKPGTEVTVIATPATHYYNAKVTGYSGVTSWSGAGEGELKSTYTFTMPDVAVSLSGNAASSMYQVRWDNTPALTFQANDRTLSQKIEEDGYAIPGHKIRITMTADGGYDPQLTSPAGATPVAGESAFIREFDFTMPDAAVTLAGTAKEYPLLTCAGDCVIYKVYTGETAAQLAEVQLSADGQKGVKPESMVKLELSAQPGYYAPRLSAPAGVTGWTTVSEANDKAVYTFTMPTSEKTVTATATTAPAITLTNTRATLTLSGKNYDGSAIGSGSGTKVQPGTEVTVTANAKTGYFDPTVSGGGVAETSRTGYDIATYTFSMGTNNVTLVGSGTADPTVSISNAGTNMTVKAGAATVSNGGSIHPGSAVTVTVTPDDTHYAPRLLSAPDGVTGWTTVSEANDKAVYTFTSGIDALNLSGAASDKRQLSWEDTGVTLSVKVNNIPVSTGAYVIPGQTVNVSFTTASGWKNGKVTASGAAVSQSGGSFTMPDNDVTLTGSADPTISWTGDLKDSTTVENTTIEKNLTSEASVAVGSHIKVTVKGYHNGKSGCNEDGYAGYIKNVTGLSGDVTSICTKRPENKKTSVSLTGVFEFDMPASPVSFEAYKETEGGCVTDGTLITLADGSQVAVEQLTGNEKLLVWNHMTGSYDTAPIAYLIDHEGLRVEQAVMHLFFEDGSDLEIIGEHVFYNADTGKYITLDRNAADYIGTHFAKQNAKSGNMDRVTLSDVKIEYKVTGVYEVVSNTHITCFTDGILSASAYTDVLLNTFEIETDTMAYNPFKVISDIKTYGLYTYDDLKDISTEEEFNMHNAALLKIAVGKGTLTYEDLAKLNVMFESFAHESAVTKESQEPISVTKVLPKMFVKYFAAKGEQLTENLVTWVKDSLQ